MICPKCQAEIPGGGEVCPKCSAEPAKEHSLLSQVFSAPNIDTPLAFVVQGVIFGAVLGAVFGAVNGALGCAVVYATLGASAGFAVGFFVVMLDGMLESGVGVMAVGVVIGAVIGAVFGAIICAGLGVVVGLVIGVIKGGGDGCDMAIRLGWSLIFLIISPVLLLLCGVVFEIVACSPELVMVDTYAGYRSRMLRPHEIVNVIEKDGATYYATKTPLMIGVLGGSSGGTAYVFDEHGSMVDYGEMSDRFREKWFWDVDDESLINRQIDLPTLDGILLEDRSPS
jgi:MFS family permease